MKVITADGEVFDLGVTEATPTISIEDYSRRVTDDFGTTTVVPRKFSRIMTVRFALPFEQAAAIRDRLAALRATPAQWVASEDHDWLNIEGFYKDLSIDLGRPPLSFCALTVEGLADPGESSFASSAFTFTPAALTTAASVGTVAGQLQAVVGGGDPAPDGRASTLRLVQPLKVFDAILASSNVAEADYPAWVADDTYAAGSRVVKSHRVFESAASGNKGRDPAAASEWWIDTGPTNRWAMFDEALGTATIASGQLKTVLNPMSVNAVAVLDAVGSTARVEALGYDRTIAIGADGTALFMDLPLTSGPGALTVTIDGAGTVSVGTLLIGRLVTLGVTEESPSVGITDYSRKETDDFGDVTVVERAWSKSMSVRGLIRTDAVDLVANRIAEVRARPSLWIGDDEASALTIYGFFKDFSIEVGENVSKLSLSVEGLSKAAPLPPAVAASVDLIADGSQFLFTADGVPHERKITFKALVPVEWGRPTFFIRDGFGELLASGWAETIAASGFCDAIDPYTLTMTHTQFAALAGNAQALVFDPAALAADDPVGTAAGQFSVIAAAEGGATAGSLTFAPASLTADAAIGAAAGQLIASTGGAWGTFTVEAVVGEASDAVTITGVNDVNAGPVNWSDIVDDDGTKPDDNATEGAPAGTDVAGRPAEVVIDMQNAAAAAISAAEALISGAVAQIASAQADIAAAQDELEQQRLAILAAGGQIETLTTTVEAQGASITTNATAISNQAGQLATLSGTVTTLGSTVSTNATAISTLTGNYATLSSIVSTQGASITTNATAISNLASDVATLNVSIGASTATEALNPSPTFANNTSPNGSAPTGWNLYDNNHPEYLSYVTPQGKASGKAVKFTVPAGNYSYFAGLIPPYQARPAGYCVVEVDLYLHSGTLRGAGVYCSQPGPGPLLTVDLFSTPDSSGVAPGAGIVGRQYRFRQLVQLAVGFQDATQWAIYCMARWGGFSSYDGSACEIEFQRCAVRPATKAEIDAGRVIPLEATVSLQAQAITSLDQQYASLSSTVSAQGASISTNAQAISTINSQYASLSSTVSAQGATVSQQAEAITGLQAVTNVQDTRNDNQPPSWYWTNYPRKAVKELKLASAIGVATSYTYGTLTTTVPWTDGSGGPIQQMFVPSDEGAAFSRYSTGASSWSAWKSYVGALDGNVAALQTQYASLSSIVSTQGSSITSNATAISTLTSNYASLSSTVTALGASVSTNASAISAINGQMSARYGITLEAGTGIARMTAMAGNGTSAWKFETDEFEITGAAGGPRTIFANGVWRVYAGAIMTAWGAGFGSSSQFVRWFGPAFPNLSQCTEGNAISYEKVDGSAYFGGSLSAGDIYVARRTTDTTATAFIEIGPFNSNGNPKQVVLSYLYSKERVGSTTQTPNVSGNPAADLVLEKWNGSAWVIVASLPVIGSTYRIFADPTEGLTGSAVSVMSGSVTFTDNSTSTGPYRFQGRLVSRTESTFSGANNGELINQQITVASTED